MPQEIETISSNLISLLKNRFNISETVDEAGKFTDDPAKIKVFSFDFINSKKQNSGCIVLSLLNDPQSSNSLKIYFGEEISQSDRNTQKEWYDFLLDLRKFCKMHLLGFDLRNLNKVKLTRQDVEKDLPLVKEDLEPMYESTFGPIDGTVRTSRQPLGSMNIVIKHTARIDQNIKNGRSHRIQKIYLTNLNGERFLLPFKSLLAARAMARHIEDGGTPYDQIGKNICSLVDELFTLNKFYRSHKHDNPENIEAQNALIACRNRCFEIRRLLNSLSSHGGYQKNLSTLETDFDQLQDEDLKEDIFRNLTISDEDALPYVQRAYHKFIKAFPEQSDFEKWVNAKKVTKKEVDPPDDPNKKVLIDKEIKESFNFSEIHNEKEHARKIVADETSENFLKMLGFEVTRTYPSGEKKWELSYFTVFTSSELDKSSQSWKYSFYWRIDRNGKFVKEGYKFPKLFRSLLEFEEFKEYLPKVNKWLDGNILREADVPVAGGWMSALTNTKTFLPSVFKTRKEIKKKENKTGKFSPLSLISKKEEDEK
ncbi:Uncharacterised protein [uncultured archaeon]|nr:Uncharacterised protein [uncultured archaeon]